MSEYQSELVRAAIARIDACDWFLPLERCADEHQAVVTGGLLRQVRTALVHAQIANTQAVSGSALGRAPEAEAAFPGETKND